MKSAIIDISEPQCEFITSEHAHPAFFGGLGSGKSEALIIRLVTLMEKDKGVSVAHYFPTYKLAKRRGLSGVQKYLKKRGIKYELNKSELTVTIPEFNNGIYYLDTYHDPDSIVSYEIAHAGVDELDTLSFENAEYAWRKITERVREMTILPQGNTLAVASTTDHGKAGFCFSVWGSGENIAKGYHYIKGGTSTNPFLPKGYVEQISKNYDPLMLEAMVNGGWVNFTANKIYHFYTRQRHKSTRTIQHGDPLHIGLDFNVGGTCATVFVRDGDKITAVDEFVSHDTQDFINNLTRYSTLDITIYPDASGNSNRTNASESDIAMIRRSGWTVKCSAANPAVRDRINAVNGLLSHDRFLVNADKCPELATALESQGYTDKGEPEKFTTHPAIDDRCFSGDIKIIVNDVLIEFKDIPKTGFIRDHKGNNILFYNGGYKGHEKIFNVLLSNGKTIRSTNDHEFLTLNGWIKAENLAGETLCNIEYYQNQFKSLTVLNITKGLTDIFIKHLASIKCCTKEKQENQYTGQHGNIITEQLKKVLLSITLTKTKAIMIFQTLQPCTNQNTILCTSQSGTSNTQNIQELQSKKYSQNVKNGTLHKLVKNGINRIMKTTKDCSIKKSLENVRYAQKNTNVKPTEEIYTVQKTAKHNREEIAELITKQGFVKRAIMRLLSISTIKHNTVVEIAQKSQNEEAVYCLTTEQGCFSLSDGSIVSNCDSAGYALSFLYPIRIERPTPPPQHKHTGHAHSWQS